jgi:hypothetical protein
MAEEYNHNQIVSDIYNKIKQEYDGAELVAKKDGEEVKLGDLSVDRRHFDGQQGAPDLIVDIRHFSMLGTDFPGKFPLALVEIESSVSAAIPDLENYAERDGRSSPVIIVTDSESATRHKNIEGRHQFKICGIPHNKIEK